MTQRSKAEDGMEHTQRCAGLLVVFAILALIRQATQNGAFKNDCFQHVVDKKFQRALKVCNCRRKQLHDPEIRNP